MDDVRFEILYDFQAVRNNYLVFSDAYMRRRNPGFTRIG